MAIGVIDDVRVPGRPPVVPPVEPPDDDDRWDDDEDDHSHRVVWQTVAAYQHPSEAHLARLRLEAAGLRCLLLDELVAATQCLSLAIGGVKLQVPEPQVDEARRLLRLTPLATRFGVAAFATEATAKQAICVVEAACPDASCSLAMNDFGDVALVVEPLDQLPMAARAIAETCFAFGLTSDGRAALTRQACPSCDATTSRASRHLPPNALHDNRFGRRAQLWSLVHRLIARRHCRRCGREF
ncbi:MAG: hypothetical protein AAF561_09505 [Planctomycetota bacterium]